MNRVDVRACVADVVLAFDTGAHLTEVLMGRSSKKRRRRREKDVQATIEQRLLYNALVESAAQCRRWSWQRGQQFGEAFDAGDALVREQLGDVLASVQRDVIEVVQAASTRKFGAPSLLRAHETAISSRQDALRAMDELCRRIIDGTVQTTAAHHTTAMAGPVQGLSRSSTVSSQVSHLTASDAGTNVSGDESYYGVPFSAPQGLLYSQPGQPTGLIRQDSFHDAPPLNLSRSRSTIHAVSYYEPLKPVAESPDCEDISSTFDSFRSMSISGATSSDGTASFETASSWSQTYSVPGQQPQVITTSDSRALGAPEVVTKDYEPMLSPTYDNFASDQVAFTYSLEHDILGTEPENIWSPLPRPARINGYHGFCKGAWQTRRNLREGLAIRVVEDEHGSGQVPYWSCKECGFRSRSKRSEIRFLTEQIHHHTKSGIRFRWLFLAKSHVSASKSTDKPENYAYGCIFCAAEGRPSAAYPKLDALMSHVVSKHKPTMMTVETKAKTKCIVGRVAGRTEDWDVNIATLTRKASVGGFVANAVAARSGLVVEEPG